MYWFAHFERSDKQIRKGYKEPVLMCDEWRLTRRYRLEYLEQAQFVSLYIRIP